MAGRLTAYLVVFIVSATLIAGLIVGAQRDDNDGPVDLIVHNAVVFDGDDSPAEAVAVRANHVLKVGSNREILRLQRPQTIMIDAKGGSVLPGFNDAHLHLVEGGLALRDVELAGATTVEEAVARVAEWAEANPKDAWIVGRGWTTFDGTATPTRQALDAVSADRPIVLLSENGETAWVNARALKMAGVKSTSGLVEGAAIEAIEKMLPPATPDERADALRAALVEATRNGITSLHATLSRVEDLELLDEARREGDTNARLYSILELDARTTDADIEHLAPIFEKYEEDPLLKLGAVEVELDGLAADPLNRLVRLLDARGWQVSIETDTPEEAEMARTAFAHAARSNAQPERERRHRLEHQARHITAVGGTIALGSDWPRGPLSPLRVMQNVLGRLTLQDALRAYSAGSAFASYDEQRKGSLEAGMLADLVVLSADIFSVERTAFDSVKVAYTIFDGRVVFPAGRRLTYP